MELSSFLSLLTPILIRPLQKLDFRILNMVKALALIVGKGGGDTPVCVLVSECLLG